MALAAFASGCATATDGDARSPSVREFVSAPVLPWAPEIVSSSASAAREIDVLDTACDERWLMLKTRAEYDAHRAHLRREMLKAIGAFPVRTPLNARTTGTVLREGYRIEKVVFESMPGVFVTGNLFIPDGGGRYPAVVMSCGHANEGKDAPVYLRACVIAVRRGFVAFMFDPYFQGERRWTGQRRSTVEHTEMGLRASLLGDSAPLLRIWDGLRAIDYMSSRPEVDPGRLGYMGQSGGGTMTALMETVDPRIRAAAPSCYLTSLRALCEMRGPQDGEQNVFGQLAFGLNHTGYVLVPDIPVAVTCKFSDAFPYSGVRTLFRTVRETEQRLGLGNRTFLNCAPGPHGWTEATEKTSVRFLAQHLLDDHSDAGVPREDFWIQDFGMDVGCAELGLDAHQRGCVAEGRTERLPGARHIFDVLAEKAVRVGNARVGRAADEKRAAAKRLARVRMPADVAVREKEFAACEIGGWRLSRIVLQYPGSGALLPAVLVVPSTTVAAPVLIVAWEGRSVGLELAQSCLEEGRPVLLADLSGVGEVGLPTYRRPDARSDEALGAMCFLMGEPLVGRRATDILLFRETLARRYPNARPSLVATGPLAVPAAHAVAADPSGWDDVRLVSRPKSWGEILEAGARMQTTLSYADVVPEAYLEYDWPDLVGE